MLPKVNSRPTGEKSPNLVTRSGHPVFEADTEANEDGSESENKWYETKILREKKLFPKSNDVTENATSSKKIRSE
jgi:hypothetical protein